MKKALISPNEKTSDPNNGNILGIRIAQVSDESFEVALPLYWIDCSDDIQADFYYFDETDNTIKQTPVYIPPPIKLKVTINN